MIIFIVWLRCLGAMLITNAHYTGIYPSDIIANGGLIGDVIFFAVSGYCLTNIRTGFFRWYGKRIGRILPAVILITIIYTVFGHYDASIYASGTEETLLYSVLDAMGIRYHIGLSWFIYPTYYHFVGSILILYIPYYFMIKIEWIRKHIPVAMGIIFIAYITIYIFWYDKSYYHIDTVREPMIRFLFMESMLLGAWFKLNDAKIRNIGFKWPYVFGALIALTGYFVSKIILSRGELAYIQPFNQIIIFVLLYLIFRCFSSIDYYLEKVPKWINNIVAIIAKLTLEIYLVQYVLIDLVRDVGLLFPLNWIVLTTSIVISAFVLHMFIEVCTKQIAKQISRGD